MRTKVRIQSTSAIFVWRSLRNFAMADFEENVEEMVGTTREWWVVTESGGDETGGPGDETGGDRWGNVYGRRGVRI